METSLKCSVCARDKSPDSIVQRKSKLSGGPLFLCSECAENKREPRYMVIIYGRQNGFDYVSEYIKAHRYVGDEILAKDLA